VLVRLAFGLNTNQVNVLENAQERFALGVAVSRFELPE